MEEIRRKILKEGRKKKEKKGKGREKEKVTWKREDGSERKKEGRRDFLEQTSRG